VLDAIQLSTEAGESCNAGLGQLDALVGEVVGLSSEGIDQAHWTAQMGR